MDSLQNAIDQRISRRKYSGIPLENAPFQNLHGLIGELNRESGLEMEIIRDGRVAFEGLNKSYGMFSGVTTLVVVKGESHLPDLSEKAGYYGERLVLEATRMELGTCWVGGTFDRKNPVLNILPSQKLISVITVGYISDNLSFKESMIRRMAHLKKRPLGYFYQSAVTPPEWFLNGIRSVQKAPSAMNRQPVKFRYDENECTAYTTGTADFDLIDLGIAKLHFELAANGRFEWGNGAKWKAGKWA